MNVVQDIRRMRGDTQAHLMRTEDGSYYVVKFQNNPLGRHALINDLIGSRIATGIGLSTAPMEIVQVSEWMLKGASGRRTCHADAGPQLGSRFVNDPTCSHVVDYFPQSMLNAQHIVNLQSLVGAALFRLWTHRIDPCQFVYHKRMEERRYTATMIDQTTCFGGVAWNYREAELRPCGTGRFPDTRTRRKVLEDWISRIGSYPEETGRKLIAEVPEQWIQKERSRFSDLLDELWNNKPSIEDAEEFLRSA